MAEAFFSTSRSASDAFSISVSDRTRQFGLLSSIGATKRQLRSSVLYEALLVGGIGVPLGILCGLLGIGITLFFIGDYFSGIFFGALKNGGTNMERFTGVPSAISSIVEGIIILIICANFTFKFIRKRKKAVPVKEET